MGQLCGSDWAVLRPVRRGDWLSCLAAYLTYLRSPYYALAYAANDVVLVALWTLAALEDASCLPMVFCFAMFLLNDLYGFRNWQRMRARQRG